MKKSVLWLSTLLLWTSLLVASPLSTEAVQEHPSEPPAALKIKPDPVDRMKTMNSPTFADAVNQWVKSIAKEKGYEAWSSATWTSYPLGPGTHGWIVLLESGGREIGYLVIHAADPNLPNAYLLSEYGSGSSPLFSLNTLYRSLVQLELIDTSYEAERWYADPLHAVWIVTAGEQTHILDAWTGEALPLTSRDQLPEISQEGASKFINPAFASPEHTIIANRQLDRFDPYDDMSWLQKTPLTPSAFTELQTLLDPASSAKLTFIAELYDGHVNMPFAVTGYQQWSNDEVYMQLEREGRRSIPARYAAAAGQLFP